jgi:hypothetical protein
MHIEFWYEDVSKSERENNQEMEDKDDSQGNTL